MDTNPAVELALAAETHPEPPRFAIRNLSVLAYAQGFTLWHYRAGQDAPLERVSLPGFFNAASDMLALGDMILTSARNGGRVLFVASAERDVVTTPLA